MSETLASLTVEQLAKRIDEQEKDVKSLSKSTIINRWNDGKLITPNQLKEIKKSIDPKSIKQIQVRQNIVDNKTKEYKGYKMVDRFFNKHVTRVDTGIGDGTIVDDEIVANANLLYEQNQADLNTKSAILSYARGGLYESRAELHTRKVAAQEAFMAEKKLRVQTLGEIYAAAVAKKQLSADDMVEHTLEQAAGDTKAQKDAVAERMLHPEIVAQ